VREKSRVSALAFAVIIAQIDMNLCDVLFRQDVVETTHSQNTQATSQNNVGKNGVNAAGEFPQVRQYTRSSNSSRAWV
jgi:hypothetical protein